MLYPSCLPKPPPPFFLFYSKGAEKGPQAEVSGHSQLLMIASTMTSKPFLSSSSNPSVFSQSISNTPKTRCIYNINHHCIFKSYYTLTLSLTKGTTISEFEAESHAICPANWWTSFTTCVSLVLAAVPHTPLPKGIKVQATYSSVCARTHIRINMYTYRFILCFYLSLKWTEDQLLIILGIGKIEATPVNGLVLKVWKWHQTMIDYTRHIR